jgi:purine-binding chemotaxis protein CheW
LIPLAGAGVVALLERSNLVVGPPSYLLCLVGRVLVALPLEHVEETMRPLPVEPLASAPSFVRGLAVVRGIPTPVVDAAALLGGVSLPTHPIQPTQPTRFVTVKAGTRRVALAVDAVVGVVVIPSSSVDALPPLFENAGLTAIGAIGVLDTELLLVLRHTRLVPDETWATIQRGTKP